MLLNVPKMFSNLRGKLKTLLIISLVAIFFAYLLDFKRIYKNDINKIQNLVLDNIKNDCKGDDVESLKFIGSRTDYVESDMPRKNVEGCFTYIGGDVEKNDTISVYWHKSKDMYTVDSLSCLPCKR